jgi:NAD(P)-dependent dehydrogenase (short-subunit alcohol dehydrogenase family)
MLGDLRGKTALVTGAGSGIGLGMARAFTEAGLRVALVDIDTKALETAAAGLAASGATVLAVPLDVTDQPAWSAAADKIEAALGPVQILCNNAGVGAMGLTVDVLTPAIWKRDNVGFLSQIGFWLAAPTRA